MSVDNIGRRDQVCIQPPQPQPTATSIQVDRSIPRGLVPSVLLLLALTGCDDPGAQPAADGVVFYDVGPSEPSSVDGKTGDIHSDSDSGSNGTPTADVAVGIDQPAVAQPDSGQQQPLGPPDIAAPGPSAPAPWPLAEALGTVTAATTPVGSLDTVSCAVEKVNVTKDFGGKAYLTAAVKRGASNWRPWTAGSPIVTAGDHIFVADGDHGEIVHVLRSTMEVVGRFQPGGRPEQLVLGPNGNLFVTLRHGHAVLRYEPTKAAAGAKSPNFSMKSANVTRWKIGREPTNLALSNDGKTLYVTVLQPQSLRVIDVASGKMRAALPTAARPMTVAVTSNGSVVVGHFKQAMMIWSEQQLLGAAKGNPQIPVEIVLGQQRLGTRCKESPTKLGLAQSLNNAVFEHAERVTAASVDPSDGSVRNVHIVARPGTHNMALMALQIGKLDPATGELAVNKTAGGYGASGSCSTPTLTRPVAVAWSRVLANGAGVENKEGAMVAGPQAKNVKSKLRSLWISRFSQPSAIAHHPTLELALVTMAGSKSVMVMKTPAAGAPQPYGTPYAEIATGAAPRGIAMRADGTEAYVLNAHDYSISIVALDALAAGPTVSSATGGLELPRLCAKTAIYFGSSPLSTLATAGRTIFSRAGQLAISSDGALACATCHLDGSEDGLVWITAAGPRQTPMLGGRLQGTKPFNWAGSEPDLPHNMVRTIHRMGGTGLAKGQLNQLAAYLTEGLSALAAPKVKTKTNTTKVALTAQESAGKALFNDPTVGCSGCHVGGDGTIAQAYDVGTASFTDKQVAIMMLKRHNKVVSTKYDTPSLRDLWKTAPYLHDGSAQTLMAVLDKTANTMGKTSHLTTAQKLALVAYLRTL